MLDTLLEKLRKLMSSRLVPLAMIFFMMFAVLVYQLFQLQIVEAYQEDYTKVEDQYKQTKNRYIDSTRGNIYDRNGNLLAYNKLNYSLVIGNSGISMLNVDKNAMLHKLIQILEENNYSIELDFGIELDSANQLVFNVTDQAELRFKKNAYGRARTDLLTEEEKNATAEEVFQFLRFGAKNVTMFNISEDYTMEETLKIMTIRYNLFSLYPQHAQLTLATDLDEKTIAAIMENQSEFVGIEILQKTSRAYHDSQYFAHLIGYTGSMSEDDSKRLNAELNLEEEDVMYSISDAIGKIGIEQKLDPELRGIKGKELLSVTNLNKVLDSKLEKEPVAGNDVYLTIDRELQIASYHILENNIAAILISKIVNSMNYGGLGKSASTIKIPIYEVYNAFIDNNVIDISHFYAEDATETEKRAYALFQSKLNSLLVSLQSVLAIDNTRSNAEAGQEIDEYLDYSYNLLLDKKILQKDVIDKEDEMYKAYHKNEISLSSFLQYSISKNWIDLSLLGIGEPLFTKDEIYDILIEHLFQLFEHNVEFEKKIYRTLIFNYSLTGKDICLMLYEQEVLKYNENDYYKLQQGSVSAYNFIINKLKELEITPGMLALEPCSGSLVITDVKTGDVLAMVTYPSYDNNMLANKVDWAYYQKLLNNHASPLINRPTQQVTTTGSTIKPLMALAGLSERIISTSTYVKDLGIFTDVVPSPKCWKYPGSHGSVNLTGAIQHSCNYFFFDIGYKMSIASNGLYSDDLGLSKIHNAAAKFGLSDNSGVEISESSPTMPERDSVRAAIGYGYNFTPTQISRYITAIANKGTVYNLTLVDKITDKDNKLIKDNEASVYNQISEFSAEEWNAVHRGMYDVVNTAASSLNRIYGNLGFKVAGKTGTAQISDNHPSNGLFVSFAPYENPEISVTVVLPNGYTSANAAKLGREIYGLYFNDENKEELLSGDLRSTTVTDINVAD